MLLVAATALELEAVGAPDGLCCGIGPVEAAIATAGALARSRPPALLHVGIAGARSLPAGALVLGSEAVYCDLAAGTSVELHARTLPDPTLLARARGALPAASVLPIGTSAGLGGAAAFEVEAMEGFAVLRAAQREGVPALELRAVSNGFGEERGRWRVEEALDALASAVASLREALGA